MRLPGRYSILIKALFGQAEGGLLFPANGAHEEAG